jgi:hypothetical protein
MYGEALAQGTEHLGAGHRYPLSFQLARGRLLVELERFDEAETALVALRRLGRDSEPPQMDLSLAAESELIQLYLATERPDLALPIAETLAARAVPHLPADQPALIVYRIQHGLVLWAKRQAEAALAILIESHGALPATHDTWRTRAATAIVAALESMGRGAEAEPWRR